MCVTQKVFREVGSRFNSIEEKIQVIPKMYEILDSLAGEIKDNRTEHTFINARVDRHEKRIMKLESKRALKLV